MGWNNQNVTNLFIINAAGGGFSGLFVYSPSPGPGNLIASIAFPTGGLTGTDPYGNVYQAGITSYGTGIFAGSWVELFEQEIVWQDTSGNESSLVPFVQAGVPYLAFGLPGFTGANLYIDGNTATILGQNAGAPESWHTMTPLGAGFAAGAQTPQYQKMPIGSTGQVHLRGSISLTANEASGVTFFSLPAAYTPTTAQEWITPSTFTNSIVGGTVQVDTSGNLKLGAGASLGMVFRLDGIIIQL